MTDASEKGLAPDFRFLEFGLAPLRPIDPELLVTGDDDVDGFVLSLALAYNDIKTIHWMNFLLQKHQPADTSTISPEAAQWNGMRVQAARWLMALAHEILHAIAHAKDKRVLDRAAVRKAVRSLPAPYATLWKELIAVSSSSSGRGVNLRPYLRNLRNSVAFHYAYPASLLKGRNQNAGLSNRTPTFSMSCTRQSPL